jgi:large subunit ribosomal protein L21
MYAVIKAGGKQYRVKPGDVLEIEHVSAKDTDGSTVTFAPILVSTDDGRTLHGAKAGEFLVSAKMLGDAKGDKVIVFKYKNKTGYTNRNGHRQLYSLIEITSIGRGAEPEAAAPEEPVAEPETVAEPVADEA